MPERGANRPANTVLTGAALAPGVAIGTAYLYRDIFDSEHDVYTIHPHDVDGQKRKHGGKHRA